MFQAPSDWHQFRSGLHLGVLVMLLFWASWASRLMSMTAHNALGKKIRHSAWSHPAIPLYRFMGCCMLVEWSWGLMLYVWNRYRINYIFMMGLRPTAAGPLHHQASHFFFKHDKNLLFVNTKIAKTCILKVL